MQGKSLKEYYTGTIDTIIELVKTGLENEYGEIKEGMDIDLVKVRVFEIINARVIQLLDEMNNKNASTLTRCLIPLLPDKVDGKDDLVDKIVDYHKAEKLAIRKFRHSDKKEVTLITMNEMFDLVIEHTGNNIV
mgnify:CR=1 FL=1